jgi:hypothetical protein
MFERAYRIKLADLGLNFPLVRPLPFNVSRNLEFGVGELLFLDS